MALQKKGKREKKSREEDEVTYKLSFVFLTRNLMDESGVGWWLLVEEGRRKEGI